MFCTSCFWVCWKYKSSAYLCLQQQWFIITNTSTNKTWVTVQGSDKGGVSTTEDMIYGLFIQSSAEDRNLQRRLREEHGSFIHGEQLDVNAGNTRLGRHDNHKRRKSRKSRNNRRLIFKIKQEVAQRGGGRWQVRQRRNRVWNSEGTKTSTTNNKNQKIKTGSKTETDHWNNGEAQTGTRLKNNEKKPKLTDLRWWCLWGGYRLSSLTVIISEAVTCVRKLYSLIRTQTKALKKKRKGPAAWFWVEIPLWHLLWSHAGRSPFQHRWVFLTWNLTCRDWELQESQSTKLSCHTVRDAERCRKVVNPPSSGSPAADTKSYF